MGRMGYGYGSEWHLMRYLARHRKFIEDKIFSTIGKSGSITWLDFEFDSKTESLDRELQGLEFLKQGPHQEILDTWKTWWPTTGRQPSWDAVAWLRPGNCEEPELLLIEAKAHVEEIKSDSGAGAASREKILNAFRDVQQDLGIQPQNDWLKPYYQHANRIAILWFLNNQNKVPSARKSDRAIPTRLINVYFTGEVHQGWQCPQTEDEWKSVIKERDLHLGLESPNVDLPVHSIFVKL